MKNAVIRLGAASVLILAIAGCGGGGSAPAPSATASEAPAVQPSASPPPPSTSPSPAAIAPYSDLLVIGNSITKIGPSPDRAWAGDWGMAASSAEKDFAHLTAAALGVPLTARNFSPLEKDPLGNLWQIPDYVRSATPRTAAVVELGDNVPLGGVGPFAAGYAALLDALHVAKLACVSTWWREESKDAVIEQACKAHGGTYVYIGDIYPQRTDDVGRYADVDTDRHPHDASMQVIAARVTAALLN